MHTTPLYTQIDLLRFSKVYIKRKFPCDDDWAVQYVWGMIGKEGDNCERFFVYCWCLHLLGEAIIIALWVQTRVQLVSS